MTDWQKAQLYDRLMEHVIKINDWGHLCHYQITIPAIGNQTFGEALMAMKPIQNNEP